MPEHRADIVNQTSTTIIAVRHGQTEWNVRRLEQGQLDSPLTELGRRQAAALAEALADQGIQAIYSSDLGRARQTADTIAARLGLPVHDEPRLRELGLGILEGRTLADFASDHPAEAAALEANDPDYALPGGESFRQCYTRAVACVQEIAAAHPGGVALVVTHGGVLIDLFHKAVELPLGMVWHHSLYNAAINVFAVKPKRWRLLTWGSVAHLRDLPTEPPQKEA